jgi:hypothetical protein
VPNKPAKKWTKKELAMLGTMPDAEVARSLGTSGTTVGLVRRRLGIPVYNVSPLQGEKLKLLGTMSDQKLADLLGVSKSLVAETRLKLRIACYRKGQGQS